MNVKNLDEHRHQVALTAGFDSWTAAVRATAHLPIRQAATLLSCGGQTISAERDLLGLQRLPASTPVPFDANDPSDPRHGATGYTRYACRCQVCRQGKAAAQKQWKQQAAQRPASTFDHGVGGYSNYSCRCEVCREQWSIYLHGHRGARSRPEKLLAIAQKAGYGSWKQAVKKTGHLTLAQAAQLLGISTAMVSRHRASEGMYEPVERPSTVRRREEAAQRCGYETWAQAMTSTSHLSTTKAATVLGVHRGWINLYRKQVAK